MKDTLLAAKFIAKSRKSEQILVEYFKEAVRLLKIKDSDFLKVLDDFLKDKNVKDLYLDLDIDKEVLKNIQNESKIPFSQDMKDLKKHLENNGFSTSYYLYKTHKISNDITTTSISQNIDIFQKIKSIKSELKEMIYSQDGAVEAVADGILKSSYKQKENLPKAIFFFLGPPATGKTHLAQSLMRVLNKQEPDPAKHYKAKFFDMASYQHDNQNFALFGSEEAYNGAKAGALTGFVDKHPYAICIFDEIEKAHHNIQYAFYNLMNSGKMEDKFIDKTVSFKNAILVFTSNVGSELYSNQEFLKKIDNQGDKFGAKKIILEAISRETSTIYSGANPQKIFESAFLSRLSQGEVVLFNKIDFK